MSKRRRQRAGGTGSPYRIYVLGALLTTAVVAVVILIAVTTSGGEDVPEGPIVIPEARSADVPQDGQVLGDPNAPVTIVEYMDYQCPFCKRAHFQVLPVIEQQYIETGIAKLEMHPIAILGDESVQAASAAECASDQGEFFFYHDTLFANQGGESAGAFADSRLREMASAIGLDSSAFDSCLDSGIYRDSVTQNTQVALNAGARSTPTFLVSGERVESSVEAISAAIEEAAGS